MFKVCTTLYGKKKLVNNENIIIRKSAYAVLIRGGQILLVNTKSTGKYWFAGGVVDDGESKEEAVIREVKEETGLNVKVIKPLIEVESYFYFDHANEAYQQFSYFYICEVAGESEISEHNPDEHDEAEKPQWVSMSVLSEDKFQDYGWEIFSFIP